LTGDEISPQRVDALGNGGLVGFNSWQCRACSGRITRHLR
jgi:hypothetical protein